MPDNASNKMKQPVEPGAMSAFPREEFDRRQQALRKILSEQGIDLLIITGPENIFYLTGHQTPGYYTLQFLGIPIEGEPFLLLRELESYNAVSNTFLREVEKYADNISPAEAISDLIRRKAMIGKRIAINRTEWYLSVALYDQIVTALGSLLDCSGVVEKLRMIKSPLEIEAIKKASQYVDAGMQAGIEAIVAGTTENHIASSMIAAAIEAGSEYMGIDPFVTSGPRSGIPHTTWRRRVLESGDAVLLEMAGCHNRYHAALMRTVLIGKGSAKVRDMMKACEEGLSAAVEEVRPGNSCAAVHNACQAVIDRYGYTKNFRKRAGYSIGISFAPDWGEGHIISLYHNVETELLPGMVFHIPPALRDYGRVGVGVSETVIVTETGHMTLSNLGRSLVEV